MTESDTIKKAMIEALKKSLGIVSTACESVGISRQTHYRWLKEDSEYKELTEDISEHAIDFVESKLFEKIEGVQIGKEMDGHTVVYDLAPSDTAIIFYLKTKAKKRGYVERQEIDHTTKGESIKEEIDYSKLSEQALREIAALTPKGQD